MNKSVIISETTNYSTPIGVDFYLFDYPQFSLGAMIFDRFAV